MIILIVLALLGAGSIVAGLVLLYRIKGKRRRIALLPLGLGLAFFGFIGILILALQYFGMAPRDGENPETEHRTTISTGISQPKRGL